MRLLIVAVLASALPLVPAFAQTAPRPAHLKLARRRMRIRRPNT